jgi:hypothetical protein
MKSLFDWVVIGLALFGIIAAVVFLPAMELIPSQTYPGSIAPGLSPVRMPAVMQGYKDVAEKMSPMFGGTQDLKPYAEGNPKSLKDAPGQLKVYAMWAVFLSLAMLLAALAYGIIGRLFDTEEKTVLPVKK